MKKLFLKSILFFLMFINLIALFFSNMIKVSNISFTNSTSTKPKKKTSKKKRVKKTSKKKTSKKKSVVTHGTIVNVSDEIVYCIGLSEIKFGEIVFLRLNNKPYEGLVVNIS